MPSKLTLKKRKELSKSTIILLILLILLLITVIITGLVMMTQQYELVRLSQTSIALAFVPTSTALVEPTITLTSTQTLVPIDTPSPTPTDFVLSTVNIGESINGMQINAECMGSGSHKLVIIAGIHGDESQPREFLKQISLFYLKNPQLIPDDVQMCVIKNMNPDGAAAVPPQRFNANYVDLNRNWDTSDWVSDINRGNGILAGGGGNSPLSEPENKALSSFLVDLQSSTQQPVIVFYYHSTVQGFSDVRPGYTIINDEVAWGPIASLVSREFAAQVNYEYLHAYEYPITGESLHWLAAHGFVGVGVEMPDSGNYSDGDLLSHIEAFKYLMNNWPE